MHIFYSALAVGTRCPWVAVVPPTGTIFFVEAPRSSRYAVSTDLRHATIFVLADESAVSTWRPSGGDSRRSGRWEMARAASEQQALGACVESLQGHVIVVGTASRSTAGT
jgi:hypothetical protein